MIPRNIIAAIDFSAATDAVLETALNLAKLCSGQVHLVHAFSLSELSESTLRAGHVMQDARAVAERELRKIAETRLKDGRVGRVIVREGDPASVLAKVAEELEADLLIVDTHHRGLERFAKGSVAVSLTRDAPCAVLVLRERVPTAD